MNFTSCVLGSECNIVITKSGFNERSISRIHNHSPAFCSKILSPKYLKMQPGFLISDFCRCLKEAAFWLLYRKKSFGKVNPDQNHRERVFPLDNINLAKSGGFPCLVQHFWGSLLVLEIGVMIWLEVLVVVLLSNKQKPPSSARKNNFCHW